MTFDEYWSKNHVRFDDSILKHQETFELGAQSRQAEIDNLKRRIGDLEDAISCSLPYIETTPTILSVLKDTLEEGWK